MIPSIRIQRPSPHSLSPRPLTLLPRKSTQLSTRRTITSDTKFSSRAAPKRLPAEPLRILFCGSDRFSAQTLNYLNVARLQTQQRRTGTPVSIWNGSGLDTVKVAGEDELLWESDGGGHVVDIDSVEVVVRTTKAVGRGRKEDNETPVEKMAKRHGLRVHHIDTFTGWEPPRNINLIIAVSFGLFVPPRIIQAAKFGGLNVHPSLLPDLRGPAPIHHAILKGYSHTGVTVQTLHPSKFDHGTILAQTRRETLYELKPETAMADHFRNLGTWGQKTLQWVLERGVYRLEHVVKGTEGEKAEPVVNSKGQKVGWYEGVVEAEGGVLNLAPKVKGSDANIVWFEGRGGSSGEEPSRWLGTHFERASKVFTSVWTVLTQSKGDKKGQRARVVFHDVKVLDKVRMQELVENAKGTGNVRNGEQKESVGNDEVDGGPEKQEGDKQIQKGEAPTKAHQQKEGGGGGAQGKSGNVVVPPYRSGHIYASDLMEKRGRAVPVRVIGQAVYFQIEDGEKWVEVPEVTIAGKPRRDAAGALGNNFVVVPRQGV